MIYSEAIDKIIPALCKAQAAIKTASKDVDNTFFKSKYADLSSVWDACRQPLADNALCVTQDVKLEEAGASVSTRVWHESGQWLEFGPMVVLIAKRDAQGFGSAATYGRRYSLAAALSIVADDDDGNGATGKPAGKTFVERMPKGDDPKPEPEPVAGISSMKKQVREACANIESATDWETVDGYLNQPDTKKLFLKVARDYETLWRGDEPGSGLAGSLEVWGDLMKRGDDIAAYIAKVETAAKK